MNFQKASKKEAKLRCAIFGPSGAGKTFTALRIATGMGGNIAVIDTERGSASKYADRFEFDVMELGSPQIDNYVEGIMLAGKAVYDILIIDSLSHGWQELLEEIDRLAKTKYKGNTWSAWSDGTPHQKKLINAILSYPGHIIATMRSKTEWTIAENNGKRTPQRVGLAPEQGKGIEYEFDLLMEMSPDHICSILKDRTGMFQDKMIEKPGEDFGKELIDWLSDGAKVEPKKPEPVNPDITADSLMRQIDSCKTKISLAKMGETVKKHIGSLTKQEQDSLRSYYKAKSDEIDALGNTTKQGEML